jgi:hypothetical protein
VRWLATTVAAAAFAVAVPAHAVETANFDGVWEGTLHFSDSSFAFDPVPDAKDTRDVKLRVEIHGPVVNVFFAYHPPDDGLPGVFHIPQVKNNAVIFGTDYSQEAGPGWTESKVVIVTPKDDKTLLVSFSRLVSNSGFDARDEKNLKFELHSDSELARVGP